MSRKTSPEGGMWQKIRISGLHFLKYVVQLIGLSCEAAITKGGICMHYDVAIIGAGEAGVFAGYELMRLRPELNILILEQGADIYSRRCPIVDRKSVV